MNEWVAITVLITCWIVSLRNDGQRGEAVAVMSPLLRSSNVRVGHALDPFKRSDHSTRKLIKNLFDIVFAPANLITITLQLTSPYYMKNSNDLVAFLNQSVYKVSQRRSRFDSF